MLKEFKEFAVKGNVMELAIAVIIGAAFGRIVSALVDNILMPIIGSILGQSFESLATTVNGVEVKYNTQDEQLNFVLYPYRLVIKKHVRTNQPKH